MERLPEGGDPNSETSERIGAVSLMGRRRGRAGFRTAGKNAWHTLWRVTHFRLAKGACARKENRARLVRGPLSLAMAFGLFLGAMGSYQRS